MNTIQNYGMTNYQSKTNNRKIAFKAGTQTIICGGRIAQNNNMKKLATYFTTLFATIFTALKINSTETSKTDGKLIIEKANETMNYIENLPEYQASKFKYVIAGCHSKQVQFGPIAMEDGSKATVSFNILDYSDGTSLLSKTLIMKDKNHEWYASTSETKPYPCKYLIIDELKENIGRGKTKWEDFYDRTNHMSFNKKGKLISEHPSIGLSRSMQYAYV